jgi:predicted DNA-binding antitoxin AbrB/MazE fold protein
MIRAMTTTAAAIYEHGVLRPLAPLPLADGAQVEVTVTDEIVPARDVDSRSVEELLRDVAALPMESSGAGFSGRDHDRVLYGGSGAAS